MALNNAVAESSGQSTEIILQIGGSEVSSVNIVERESVKQFSATPRGFINHERLEDVSK